MHLAKQQPVRLDNLGFDEANERLGRFLDEIGWPTKVIWMSAAHCLVMPSAIVGNTAGRLALFRPPDYPNVNYARHHFLVAQKKAHLVRFHALANDHDKSYVVLESFTNPGQGEVGFERGLKFVAVGCTPEVKIIRSWVGWWLLTRLHRRWERQRDRAVGSLKN